MNSIRFSWKRHGGICILSCALAPFKSRFIEDCKCSLPLLIVRQLTGIFSHAFQGYRTLRNSTLLSTNNTIIRFLDWPEDALHEVAVKLMADETALGTGDAKAKVCKLFVTIHKSVVDMSAKMFAQHRRRNYVTPTSYLDFGKG